MKSFKFVLMLAWSAMICTTVVAQDDYPSRSIKIIVPTTPGTGQDVIARLYADELRKIWGQAVVVENRQGAGGTIATRAVASAPPDGYTLLMVNSQHAISPAVYDNLPYDTVRDFSGLALVGEAPSLVVVSNDCGARTLAEFIALAKKSPGAIHYGSAGVGAATHLAGAYFANRAGIDLAHIPYKNSSDLISDIVTDRIQAVFVPAPFMLPQIQAGKVRALAVTSRQASHDPVEVPSVSQAAGIPNYEFVTWFGFVASSKVPLAIREKLARSIDSIGKNSVVLERFKQQGIVPRSVVLKDFDAYIKADIDKLAPIVLAAGVKAN